MTIRYQRTSVSYQWLSMIIEMVSYDRGAHDRTADTSRFKKNASRTTRITPKRTRGARQNLLKSAQTIKIVCTNDVSFPLLTVDAKIVDHMSSHQAFKKSARVQLHRELIVTICYRLIDTTLSIIPSSDQSRYLISISFTHRHSFWVGV